MDSLLGHHIYEIRKGIRRLSLLTLRKDQYQRSLAKLESCGVSHLAKPCGTDTLNIFLGHPSCLRLVDQIVVGDLSRLSPEQDFMLGALLGYDLPDQCERYFRQKARNRRLEVVSQAA